MYVGKGYVEGWEDEDKDLNVFDYDCEVYDLSTKPLLESVKELVDGDSGLVDDKLMASNCDPEGFSKGMNEGNRATAETIDVLNSESMESTKDMKLGY
ncbi:hypothetical protein Tco_0133132 [Tanacetum coccineum]